MDIRIGFHVSISGSISNSVANALKVGCSSFQIFSRNPKSWTAKPIDNEDAKIFQIKLKNSKIQRSSVIVHMPYLPNLSAPHGELYKKSIDTLSEEVHRCTILDIPYLVIHLGSHLGKGPENGINQLINACNHAIDNYKSYYKKIVPVTVLLENSAGQKNCIGSKFEEVRLMLDKLNSHSDHHEHIGLGQIGEIGFAALFTHKKVMNLPIIMETPIDKKRGDPENLK